MHIINISELWCCDKKCSAYGKSQPGSIVFKEAYRNNQNSLFICTACGHCFNGGCCRDCKEVIEYSSRDLKPIRK
jgi:hypothetical protein